MKRAPFRHAFEYAAFLPLAASVSRLGIGPSRCIGRALGSAVAMLPSSWKQTALHNLERVFPELPIPERMRMARAAFRHFGATFLETLPMLRLDAVDLCQRVTWEGFEHLQAAESRELGVIILSAHFGCWEVVPLALAATSRPLASVGRPLDNPHVNRWVQRLRTRFGNRSLPKRGAVREMLRILERGERLGFLLDQRVRPAEGIQVPFFGHPAWTSPLVARLALRTGTPVVSVAAYPEARGRFRIRFRPPMIAGGTDNAETVLEFTRALLAQDEATIREQPELWFWFHERWKL